MSRQLQIFNVVLAITAFTLVVACPPTCIKPVYTKDNQDVFEFYEQFSEEQITNFFQRKNMNEVLQSYKSYKSSNCEQIKQAYITSIYQYYSKQKCVDKDVQEMNEYVQNQSGDSKSQNEDYMEVKTKEGQDIFEFFEQFSEEQVTIFFTQKGMQEVLQLYKPYKISKCQQAKLEYIKCLYKYYSKTKCVDQDVQEFNKFIKNNNENSESQTQDSAQNETNVSDQSDNTNSNQDISDVRTKDGQIIFEFYEQFSKEQIISFFEQKGMNEVVQAYKSYKSSESQQDKLTYSRCLSRYYSKHKYADQHVQEITDYVSNQNGNAKSENGNISEIKTSDGQSIFEFYEQFSKEQIISFFEQKGMNEVIQAYKSYKSSGSQQDKLTYSKCLSCYYSKHKYADQHVQEITDYVSNQNGNAKSENGNISEIKTSDGQSIFEFFEQHTEEQVISFFEKKDMSEIVQAYKSYKSSRCQPTRQAYIKSLYQYYSKHGCAQQHIHEMNEYLKNENSNCSSNGQQFFATEEVQLVNSYTKTVSRSI